MKRHGFTLVELLVVCALLTFVTATASGFGAGALRVWERLERYGDEAQRSLVGLKRVRVDLERVRRFQMIPFEGQYDRVSFAGVATDDSAAPIEELVRIGYYANERTQQLCRSIEPFRVVHRRRITDSCDAVMDGVSRVRFSFLGQHPETGTFSWHTRWSAAEPPVAVRIDLASEDESAADDIRRSMMVVIPIARLREEKTP